VGNLGSPGRISRQGRPDPKNRLARFEALMRRRPGSAPPDTRDHRLLATLDEEDNS